MIVGVRHVDLVELERYCSSLTLLNDYCERLVPAYVRHIKAIRDNQKYIVAMYIRKLKHMPFNKKQELTTKLLDDVEVTGVLNEVIEIREILSQISMTKLLREMFKEELAIYAKSKNY